MVFRTKGMTSWLTRLLLALFCCGASLSAATELHWQTYGADVFVRARREHKFVLMDLEAGWCHWCHVMANITYRDPNVQAALVQNYLLVRVDQDARPDLAARYEDYGWPATIIYAGDGTEIVKKQGYIPPRPMLRLLRAVVADPSPVNYGDSRSDLSEAPNSAISPERRGALRQQWVAGWDEAQGGWGFSHKFLDADSVEWALSEADGGDLQAAARAQRSLDQARHLIDPVWGGVYQYSVGGVWTDPHFEKIMPMQADNLRIYALAYSRWHRPADLQSARQIAGYLRRFLRSPEGAYFVSQDADVVDSQDHESGDYFALSDAARRARGMPRIDRHIYARENGWAIQALADYAAWTGNATAAVDAETAARWVIAHRALAGGGFRHDERDAAGPYFGDTLAMGRACLSLYSLTADPSWLARASAAAAFLRRHFTHPAAASFDEDVDWVRFAAALAPATGRAADRDMGEQALRWLLAPGLAERRGPFVAGLLLAEHELHTDPLHVAVIGSKHDPQAADFYSTAQRIPTEHKLIEWWDRSEGPAPRSEDIYPDLGQAAAYLCYRGTCSQPFTSTPALDAWIASRLR